MDTSTLLIVVYTLVMDIFQCFTSANELLNKLGIQQVAFVNIGRYSAALQYSVCNTELSNPE